MSQEDQLGAILGNPQVMAQIQKLAQSLGEQQEQAPSTPPPKENSGGDMEMLKAFTGFAREAAIDKNQQALLKALGPYISRERQRKLEKAMRAAKLAQLSSGLLESGMLQKLTGG